MKKSYQVINRKGLLDLPHVKLNSSSIACLFLQSASIFAANRTTNARHYKNSRSISEKKYAGRTIGNIGLTQLSCFIVPSSFYETLLKTS